jgi:hypothetical protein
MDHLKEYTNTQLLKLINDAKADHDAKKTLIKTHLATNRELFHKAMEAEETINSELKELEEIENKYVRLMEELSNRQYV